MDEQGWLVLTVKPGEGAMIGGCIEVRISDYYPIKCTKLVIKAPRDIDIRRLTLDPKTKTDSKKCQQGA